MNMWCARRYISPRASGSHPPSRRFAQGLPQDHEQSYASFMWCACPTLHGESNWATSSPARLPLQQAAPLSACGHQGACVYVCVCVRRLQPANSRCAPRGGWVGDATADDANLPHAPQPENVFIPNGNAADLEAECLRYEMAIRKHGGIELFLGGIGPDGHMCVDCGAQAHPRPMSPHGRPPFPPFPVLSTSPAAA